MTLTQYLSKSMLAILVACGAAIGSAAAADVPAENPPVTEQGSDAASSGSSASSGSAETSEQARSPEDLAEIESLLQEQLDKAGKNREISFETDQAQAELVSKDQPEWLSISPEESLIQHKKVVASKLYFSAEETDRDLDKALRDAVDRYVNAYLQDEKAYLLIRHDTNYIRENLMSEKFDEVWNVKQFNTNMVRRHALLDFNDAFRTRLDGEWRDVTQTSKLLTTGLAAFGVLGLLGVAFMYLRLDSSTKGYYSGRLQFLSAVAILALAAAGALFANVNADWLRWM